MNQYDWKKTSMTRTSRSLGEPKGKRPRRQQEDLLEKSLQVLVLHDAEQVNGLDERAKVQQWRQDVAEEEAAAAHGAAADDGWRLRRRAVGAAQPPRGIKAGFRDVGEALIPPVLCALMAYRQSESRKKNKTIANWINGLIEMFLF